MQLFRITKEQYLENLSGLGGSYEDGARWNLPGTPVIYFALSAAVAQLEMANYTVNPRMVPKSFRLGVYQLDDAVELDRLDPDSWPEGWYEFPYQKMTQQIGDQFLGARQSLGLIVPSCAIPGGLGEIVVINPYHADIEKIRLVATHKNIFNPRAFLGV